MSKMNYIVGDATEPTGDGMKIIAHSCNSKGGWGKGFVMSISKKWKKPERDYKYWHKLCNANGSTLPLGRCQFVWCEPNIVVANMIAQEGYTTKDKPAFNLEAARKCLKEVYEYAKDYNASIHLPRIGVGLGGFPEWHPIEQVIEEELCSKGIEVFVYDLKTSN